MNDRWTCRHCGWVYEGPCRPHEPFGWTVEEVGAHQWQVHGSVLDSNADGKWEHISAIGTDAVISAEFSAW